MAARAAALAAVVHSCKIATNSGGTGLPVAWEHLTCEHATYSGSKGLIVYEVLSQKPDGSGASAIGRLWPVYVPADSAYKETQ